MTPVDESDPAVQLAQRLLAHPHPLGGYSTVELFPGRVPDDAAIDLVIPSSGRLLGTAVERRDGELSAVQAIVDIDQPRAAAIGAYERDLRSAGWSEAYFGAESGFISSSGGPPRMYERGERGPLLMVHSAARSASETELRLRVDLVSRDRPPRYERPEAMDLMPALYAPPGVDMQGGGGSGGDGYFSSHAIANTTLPLPDLEGFFADQLSRDGWTRLSGGAADVMAWSFWELPRNEHWRALLAVLASPEKDERWLTVHVQRPSRSRAGWRGAF